MKKSALIILLILINSIYCRCQQRQKDSLKNNTILKLEQSYIDTLNKHQTSEVSFKLNDTTIEISTIEGHYVEVKRVHESPFSAASTYYIKSHNIKSSGRFFYRIPIGQFQKYNEQGNVIEELDYDKPYKFTIEQLIVKMRQDYHTELMPITKKVSVFRYIDDVNHLPEYEIDYYINERSFRYIKLNGNTGAVISDMVSSFVE